MSSRRCTLAAAAGCLRNERCSRAAAAGHSGRDFTVAQRRQLRCARDTRTTYFARSRCKDGLARRCLRQQRTAKVGTAKRNFALLSMAPFERPSASLRVPTGASNSPFSALLAAALPLSLLSRRFAASHRAFLPAVRRIDSLTGALSLAAHDVLKCSLV